MTECQGEARSRWPDCSRNIRASIGGRRAAGGRRLPPPATVCTENALPVARRANVCTLVDMDRDVERVVEAVHALTDVTGTDSVQALIAAQDVLEARIADALRALDREGAVVDDGALNLVHWLRTQCGRTDRDARRLALRAARLAGCPALARAWRHGQLSTAQIDLVASAVNDRTGELVARARRGAGVDVDRPPGVGEFGSRGPPLEGPR